ncbi:MAG: FmdB family zinc ribbon protein [Micrococcales bacterium]
MPTYTYKCLKCERVFDVQQSINDEALKTCDACQGELKKVFGKIAVTFKGSGFYRTDSGPAPKSD